MSKNELLAIVREWLAKSEFKPYPGEKPDKHGNYWRTVGGRKIKFEAGANAAQTIKDNFPKWTEEDEIKSDDQGELIAAYRKTLKPINYKEFRSQQEMIYKAAGKRTELDTLALEAANAVGRVKLEDEDYLLFAQEFSSFGYDGEHVTSDEIHGLKSMCDIGSDGYQHLLREKGIKQYEVEEFFDKLGEQNLKFSRAWGAYQTAKEAFWKHTKKIAGEAKYLYRGTSMNALNNMLERTPDSHHRGSRHSFVSTTMHLKAAEGFSKGVILIYDKSHNKNSEAVDYDYMAIETSSADEIIDDPYPMGYSHEHEVRLDPTVGYRQNGLKQILISVQDYSDPANAEKYSQYEKIAPVKFIETTDDLLEDEPDKYYQIPDKPPLRETEDEKHDRISGNRVLNKMFKAFDIYASQKLYDEHVLTKKSTIQKAMAYSKSHVDTLLDNIGKHDKWQYSNPFYYEGYSQEKRSEPELPYITEMLYKGRAQLAVMKAGEYLEILYGFEDWNQDINMDKVDKLAEQLKSGVVMHSLQLNYKGDRLTGHEGRHRSLAAIKAFGRDAEIPVYFISDKKMTDSERSKLAYSNYDWLKPEYGYGGKETGRMMDMAKAWLNKAGKFKPYRNEKPDKNGHYWRTVNGRKIRFEVGDNVRSKIEYDFKEWSDFDHEGKPEDEIKTEYRKTVPQVDNAALRKQEQMVDSHILEKSKLANKIMLLCSDIKSVELGEKEYEIAMEVMGIDDSYTDPRAQVRRIMEFDSKNYRMFMNERSDISIFDMRDMFDRMSKHNPELRKYYGEYRKKMKAYNDINRKMFQKCRYLYRGTSTAELDAYAKYDRDQAAMEGGAFNFISTSMSISTAQGFSEGAMMVFDASEHKHANPIEYDYMAGAIQGDSEHEPGTVPYTMEYQHEKEVRLDKRSGYRHNKLKHIVFPHAKKSKSILQSKYGKLAQLSFGSIMSAGEAGNDITRETKIPEFVPAKKMSEMIELWLDKAGAFKPKDGEKPDKDGNYWRRTKRGQAYPIKSGQDVGEARTKAGIKPKPKSIRRELKIAYDVYGKLGVRAVKPNNLRPWDIETEQEARANNYIRAWNSVPKEIIEAAEIDSISVASEDYPEDAAGSYDFYQKVIELNPRKKNYYKSKWGEEAVMLHEIGHALFSGLSNIDREKWDKYVSENEIHVTEYAKSYYKNEDNYVETEEEARIEHKKAVRELEYAKKKLKTAKEDKHEWESEYERSKRGVEFYEKQFHLYLISHANEVFSETFARAFQNKNSTYNIYSESDYAKVRPMFMEILDGMKLPTDLVKSMRGLIMSWLDKGGKFVPNSGEKPDKNGNYWRRTDSGRAYPIKAGQNLSEARTKAGISGDGKSKKKKAAPVKPIVRKYDPKKDIFHPKPGEKPNNPHTGQYWFQDEETGLNYGIDPGDSVSAAIKLSRKFKQIADDYDHEKKLEAEAGESEAEDEPEPEKTDRSKPYDPNDYKPVNNVEFAVDHKFNSKSLIKAWNNIPDDLLDFAAIRKFEVGDETHRGPSVAGTYHMLNQTIWVNGQFAIDDEEKNSVFVGSPAYTLTHEVGHSVYAALPSKDQKEWTKYVTEHKADITAYAATYYADGGELELNMDWTEDNVKEAISIREDTIKATSEALDKLERERFTNRTMLDRYRRRIQENKNQIEYLQSKLGVISTTYGNEVFAEAFAHAFVSKQLRGKSHKHYDENDYAKVRPLLKRLLSENVNKESAELVKMFTEQQLKRHEDDNLQWWAKNQRAEGGKFVPYKNEKPDKRGFYWRRTKSGKAYPIRAGQNVKEAQINAGLHSTQMARFNNYGGKFKIEIPAQGKDADSQSKYKNIERASAYAAAWNKLPKELHGIMDLRSITIEEEDRHMNGGGWYEHVSENIRMFPVSHFTDPKAEGFFFLHEVGHAIFSGLPNELRNEWAGHVKDNDVNISKYAYSYKKADEKAPYSETVSYESHKEAVERLAEIKADQAAGKPSLHESYETKIREIKRKIQFYEEHTNIFALTYENETFAEAFAYAMSGYNQMGSKDNTRRVDEIEYERVRHLLRDIMIKLGAKETALIMKSFFRNLNIVRMPADEAWREILKETKSWKLKPKPTSQSILTTKTTSLSLYRLFPRSAIKSENASKFWSGIGHDGRLAYFDFYAEYPKEWVDYPWEKLPLYVRKRMSFLMNLRQDRVNQTFRPQPWNARARLYSTKRRGQRLK